MATDLRFDVTALDNASKTFARMAAAVEKVERRLEALDGKKANAEVDVNTERATKKLQAFDKSLSGSIIHVSTLARALKTVTLPAALLAAAPAVTSLGSAAVSASGALLLLPAAGAAAAAAVGTLAVGLAHVSDALGPTGTPAQLKKVNEAMAALSPSALAAVKAIRGLGPAWSELRLDVQERLFRGMTEQIQALAGTYLPVLRTGLGGIAEQLNASARGFAEWARSEAVVGDMADILARARDTMAALVPAGTNVAAALMDIARVGADFLPDLAAGFTTATERFRTFIAEARTSGQLREWIQGGIDTLTQLGRIAVDVGATLGMVFSAADASGMDFLGTIERATSSMRGFMESTAGRESVTGFFAQLREAGAALVPGLQALASAAGQMMGSLADSGVLVKAAQAVSALAVAAAPLLGTLGQLATAVLPPMLDLLTAMAPVLGPIAVGFLAVNTASKGLGLVTGLVTGLGAALSGAATRVGDFSGKLGAGTATADRFATASSRIETVFRGLGVAAPILATAVIGLSWAYDQLRSKAEESAAAVAAGSMTFQQSVDEELRRLQARTAAYEGMQGEGYAAGQAIGELTGKIDTNSVSLAQEREAARLAEEGWRQYLATLTPVQAAKAQLQRAETEYQTVLRQFPPLSVEVQTASANLTAAQRALEVQEYATRNSVDLHTASQELNRQKMLEAEGASRTLERAELALEGAEQRAAAAVRDHGAASLEGRTAMLAARDAADAVVAAAGREAEAKARASGAADTHAARTEAERQKLRELISTMDGPLKSSLENTAARLHGLPDGHFKVTAEGAVTFDTARKLLNNPNSYATGGVLPGYTPGRDVHRFVSPTGGILDLSGGEPIMRPEFGRVVGPGWVHAANKAARTGGIRGVQEFLYSNAPGRIEAEPGFARGGVFPHQRFAAGGFAFSGRQPFKSTAEHQYDVATDAAVEWLRERVAAKMRALIAAMSAAGMGGGSGQGWRWQMNVLRQRFPGLALISGFRPGAITATGNRSYHGMGRAVDVPPRMDVFNWIKATYGGNTKELIFSPAGGGQVHNGRPHMYTGITRANHWDHVHWAMRHGGVLPVKLADNGALLQSGQAAVNMSGHPERVLNPAQTRSYDQRGPSSDRAADEVAALRVEVRRLGEVLRNQTAATINVEDRSGDPVETAQALKFALRMGR